MSGKCFPRSVRLLGKADFDAVFRAGHSVGSSFFRVLVLPSKTNRARLGITISKRIVAAAHDRNRIKRLLREEFRIRRTQMPWLDMVILARGSIISANNEMLRKDIYKVFSRVVELKLVNLSGGKIDSPEKNILESNSGPDVKLEVTHLSRLKS